MHYSNNPCHVAAHFFKDSGKWYETRQIDMKNFYFSVPLVEAVKKATEGILVGMTVVVVNPYHNFSSPVMIKGTDR